MAKDAAHIQQNCPRCQEIIDVNDTLFIQEAEIGDNLISTTFNINYSLPIELTLSKSKRSPPNSSEKKTHCSGKDLTKRRLDA